jgi:hypothetical protein
MMKIKQALKREFHQLKPDTFRVTGIDQAHQASLWAMRMNFHLDWYHPIILNQMQI